MSNFVYTDQGFVNLDKVEIVRIGRSEYHLVINNEVVGSTKDFEAQIVFAIPVEENWECLHIEDDEDGSLPIEPVIAWGFTVLGNCVPVTPVCTEGVHENYLLRKSGDPRVYEPQNGAFEKVSAWVKGRYGPPIPRVTT